MTTLYVILGITVLALVALVILWLYLKKKNKQAAEAEEPAAAGSDEIEQAIREAEARLAGAKLERGARVGDLPVFLLVGETGTSKTTVMQQSGLEPELVSGQIYQNNDVIPTPAANIWFSRQALFVESGGKLLADAGKWKKLVRKLAPGRSVVGNRGLASRAVIVFYNCEAFLQPNAQEAAAAAARNLRARLAEISQAMGIDLPVYVLFSKMDRLPFFTEYVRNFSNEEAGQVVGVTLPMRVERQQGIYAEQETARLTGCFERLFVALADSRPEFLSRENDGPKLPDIYEFPREFRKIRSAAVQFLLDLCRPSQLSVGPFLRGFYFTGVRPVIITETAPAAAPAAQPAESFDVMSGATQILRRGIPMQTPQQAAAPARYASTRKVPQWMFLGHFFNDVLLADRVAQGASGANVKTNALRRILLATAAAICLVFAIGFTVSFFNNRALQARVRNAAAGVSAPASAEVATLDALRNLDNLRQALETLVTYRREDAPFWYRWWLYSGNDLYPQARRLYFARFRQLLFASTQNDILENLRRLPLTPGPQYNPTYDALKAYLITTSNHDKSTRDFLSPVLLQWWTGTRKVDPERTALAQKQFDFYADQLKEENPFSSENDAAAVTKARHYLMQFGSLERVYAFILSEAGKKNRSLNFNREFPAAVTVAADPHEVPGAFVKDGWNYVTKEALPHADRYFTGEQWVLGTPEGQQIDRNKLEQDLRNRYYADFIKEWRTYLKSASLVPYTDVKDAAQKLGRITSSDSPLLAVFSLASQHTAVDDPAVANALQPVQAVVPPESKGRLITPANQNYINALGTLQTSLESSTGQADDPAIAQTLNNAPQAKMAARQIGQTFRPDSDADMKATTQKLLEDPITNLEQMLRGSLPRELNGAGAGLCSSLRTVTGKYPFNPNSKAEVTLPELNSVFRKPDGMLWALYEKTFKKVLVKQGNQYVAQPGGTVTVNPAFVSFFNAAAGFSDALYPVGATEPTFTYTLTPVPNDIVQTITVRIDGQTLTYSLGSPVAPKPFTWKGSGTHDVTAGVRFGGPNEITWLQESGLWSLFRFFGMAEQRTPRSLEWIVRIGRGPATVNGRPVTVRLDVDLGAAAPFLRPASLACVAEVAR